MCVARSRGLIDESALEARSNEAKTAGALAPKPVSSEPSAPGVVRPDLGGFAYAARVQSDGRILVAGRRFGDGKWEAALLRLNADGSLDASYGNAGVRALSIGNASGLVSLTIQPDGKPLAAGYVHTGAGGEDLAVFRFQP